MPAPTPKKPPPQSPSSTPQERGPLLGALLRRCHQALIGDVTRGVTRAGYADFQPAHNVVMRPLWDHPEGVRSTELAAQGRITKHELASGGASCKTVNQGRSRGSAPC